MELDRWNRVRDYYRNNDTELGEFVRHAESQVNTLVLALRMVKTLEAENRALRTRYQELSARVRSL